MPTITSIGHVGIYCDDVEKMLDFYTRVLGFHVTDQRPEAGFFFLSSQPDTEHHMILLRPGGRGDGKVLQQLSFHTGSLAEVRDYTRRLRAEGAKISETITHGNAVSVYFWDPEGNRLEIYWDTNMPIQQPFKEDIDLEADDEGVMAQVRAHVDAKGRPWAGVQS
jgi:catechol 2,3-dioxygenase-like lactoylglutathione lyase family enzyme